MWKIAAQYKILLSLLLILASIELADQTTFRLYGFTYDQLLLKKGLIVEKESLRFSLKNLFKLTMSTPVQIIDQNNVNSTLWPIVAGQVAKFEKKLINQFENELLVSLQYGQEQEGNLSLIMLEQTGEKQQRYEQYRNPNGQKTNMVEENIRIQETWGQS